MFRGSQGGVEGCISQIVALSAEILPRFCTLSPGTRRDLCLGVVLFPKLGQTCSDRLATCDSESLLAAFVSPFFEILLNSLARAPEFCLSITCPRHDSNYPDFMYVGILIRFKLHQLLFVSKALTVEGRRQDPTLLPSLGGVEWLERPLKV